MLKVGTIKEIRRYPVKGMAGEQLQRCKLGNMGLQGDRIWAVHDTERQEIQSCKFRPPVAVVRGALPQRRRPGDHVDVLFPNGKVLGSDHPRNP